MDVYICVACVVDRMKVMVKGGILKVSYKMSRREIYKEQLTDWRLGGWVYQDDADLSKLAIKEVSRGSIAGI